MYHRTLEQRMAKGNEKVFSGSIPSDDSLLSGAPAFPYSSTLAGGLFTPTPLDLPAAYSPVDIDYDTEGSECCASHPDVDGNGASVLNWEG